MLEHDDILTTAVEHARGSSVVAAPLLEDLYDHLGLLLDALVTHNRRQIDGAHPIGGEQRDAEIAREGANTAGARRIGGDDRDAHGTPSITLADSRHQAKRWSIRRTAKLFEVVRASVDSAVGALS